MRSERIAVDTQGLASRFLPYHRWVVLALESILFLASGITAFLLRFDFAVPYDYVLHLQVALIIWLLTKVPVFALLGLSRGWWRYVSSHDLVRLALGNLLGSTVSAAGILYFLPTGFPRSIYVLDLLLSFLFTAGARVATRVVADFSKLRENKDNKKRVLIYGAGDAGVSLLREIRQNSALLYNVVGFVDDNPQKAGLVIQGSKVLGGSLDPLLVQRFGIDTVLIAIPSASGAQMTQIIKRCQEAGVAYKTIPGLGEVIEGTGLASQIREVAVEDLLGRRVVRLDADRIRLRLHDKVVAVTGAGGSIGSELCRQIARFQPRAIVGFDIAETALFHLDKEMSESFPAVPFYPEVGSIQNTKRLSEVFRRHCPSILYHAAAYKHVPMMELHVFEAIENNVFGTLEVALAASQHGIDDFVMISSDKAVRPTSIMGASKRLAELLILSLRNGSTKFVSVRFGNVLGSNGSVVPLFKRQVAAGGPITVTHPEMRRYFMTIPEAAQLVLQASIMGADGEIFVLDMGQPIRIQDLARNLILLSGLRPDEDIKIEFTGIRPGEKLYEELSVLEENTLPTFHEKIKVFAGSTLSNESMRAYTAKLREVCAARDLGQLILTLKEIVPDYNPSAHLLSRILQDEPPPVARTVTA